MTVDAEHHMDRLLQNTGLSVFMTNSDGVHMMNPIAGEFSFCGDAYDGHLGDNEPMLSTGQTYVTCPKCITMIEACRKVKVRKQ